MTEDVKEGGGKKEGKGVGWKYLRVASCVKHPPPPSNPKQLWACGHLWCVQRPLKSLDPFSGLSGGGGGFKEIGGWGTGVCEKSERSKQVVAGCVILVIS